MITTKWEYIENAEPVGVCRVSQGSNAAEANAELIVRAVNSFEPMREALRSALPMILDTHDVAVQIRAALAIAAGRAA